MKLRSAISGLMSLLLTCCIGLSGSAAAQQVDADTAGLSNPRIHPKADPAVHLWGAYAGYWDVTWEAPDADGVWQSGKAEWNFFPILGGFGMQDVWIGPPREAFSDALEGRYIGTNIRMYDPKEKIWRVRWTNNRFFRFAHFTAAAEGARIVMVPEGEDTPLERYVFFNQSANGFEWIQETRAGVNDDWKIVQRIHALRRDDLPQ